jgi:hypothetical protein
VVGLPLTGSREGSSFLEQVVVADMGVNNRLGLTSSGAFGEGFQMRWQMLFVGMMVALCASGVAEASYLLTPVSGGSSQLTVAPGNSFALNLVVSSTGADTCTSAVFTVDFSKSGLRLDNYTWGGSFAGSAFDNSTPLKTSLPVIITAATYVPPVNDGKCDLYFDCFTPTPFSTGTLLTLNLTVPAGFDYGSDGKVLISVVPDTFSAGVGSISTTPGTSFAVVPEPSMLLLLGAGLAALAGRRKLRSR